MKYIKQQYFFLFACLAITAGLMQSFYIFKAHFSPTKEYQLKLSQKEHQLEKEKLRVAVLTSQFEDFKTQVAGLIPDQTEGPMRSLASVTQDPVENTHPIDLSTGLLNQVKASFKKGDYKSSISDANGLISKFPTSPAVIQAHFFLAESYYLNGQQQECLDVVEKMMTHYPDNELTGYIMLRMAQVLASRNHIEEADEVFRTIEKKFSKHADLKNQARRLAESVD